MHRLSKISVSHCWDTSRRQGWLLLLDWAFRRLIVKTSGLDRYVAVVGLTKRLKLTSRSPAGKERASNTLSWLSIKVIKLVEFHKSSLFFTYSIYSISQIRASNFPWFNFSDETTTPQVDSNGQVQRPFSWPANLFHSNYCRCIQLSLPSTQIDVEKYQLAREASTSQL